MDPLKNDPPKCDLCGDNEAPKALRGRCHMTAPLRLSLFGDVLIANCYIPECNREVARFKVTEIQPGRRLPITN
jgi:hypothetical protein